MTEESPNSWSDLLTIFDTLEKSALETHLAEITVTQRDLVDLIRVCALEQGPLGHRAIYRQHHPAHLSLTDENLSALSQNGVGPFNPAAQKTINKVFAMFQERRLFAAHFFWAKADPAEWHLFYFDQKDTSGAHWIGGPHLHLMNMVTHPQLDGFNLLMKLESEDRPPRLSGGFHIRFSRAGRLPAGSRDN